MSTHLPTHKVERQYTDLCARLVLLFLTGLLLFSISRARAQEKSVEDYPNVHNTPLRLRLIEGRHGSGMAGARLTLTGGYDERDLKLKMWTAEIKTDQRGEATLPRMIANLPLLAVKGARLSACEGQPKQGYYSVEEIRDQGLSTINGCGASRDETDPGIFTLIVERKSKDAKIEKKQENKTLKADAKQNHEKIYRTNGTLIPSEAESTNAIDPSQLNFTAPQTPLEQQAQIGHSTSTQANPHKPSLFALNTKPTLIPAAGKSQPTHEATPDLDTIHVTAPTTSPISFALSIMSLVNGGVIGGYKGAALHRKVPMRHAAKPQPNPTSPATKPTPAPAKPNTPAPTTTTAPAPKPSAGK